ncbi:hypothetical protein N9A42_00715 [bacterium]|nr:hypothetical protein [bacterium]
MATKQFFHDIDLVKVGQLVDARIQNVSDAEESALASSLSGSNAGLVVYNTTTATLKIWDGSAFRSVSSDIDGDIVFKGVINPTNLASKVSGAKKGFQFVADVAADLVIGGTTHTVEVGDVVLFTHEDGATEDATVFNRNIDAATTDVAGIVELATVAETSAGTAGDRAITPASFSGSQWAADIAQNRVDIDANDADISGLKTFTGEGTSLSTTASDLAAAVNELVSRADSADGEVDALEAFAGEGVTLATTATTLATAINELVGVDSDASARSAAIEANVATLQTDVGAKTSLVTDVKSSLVAAINELHGEIDQNASDIASNSAAIQSNASDIAANLAAIQGNDSDIAAIDARVTQVEADLQNSVATDVASLQAQIDGNDSDVVSLQSQITANDGELATLQTEMDAVEGRATSLEARATTLETEMDTAEGRLDAAEGRLTVNEGDIDALEAAVGTVADLDTTATDLVAAINEIHGEADAIDGRMSTAESEIQALEDQAGTDTLTTASQTLSGAVNELKGRADTAASDITSLEGRADVLEARDNIGSFSDTVTLTENTVFTLNHGLGLAAATGFVVNVLDSDNSQISVDIAAKDANSIELSSLVTISGVKVTVMGKKA